MKREQLDKINDLVNQVDRLKDVINFLARACDKQSLINTLETSLAKKKAELKDLGYEDLGGGYDTRRKRN